MISLGAPIGIAGYVVWYGKATSYLTDDPKACMNCHVMKTQYSSWSKSTHRAVATCNSCHAPGNIVQKLKTKALNGMSHSYAFTTDHYQEPIRIKPQNRIKVQSACLNCHSEIFGPGSQSQHQKTASCLNCHSDVGHAQGTPEKLNLGVQE